MNSSDLLIGLVLKFEVEASKIHSVTRTLRCAKERLFAGALSRGVQGTRFRPVLGQSDLYP